MVDVDQMKADLLTARKARDKVTEVARLELTTNDYVRIIEAELAEAKAAAAQVRAENAILARYLDT